MLFSLCSYFCMLLNVLLDNDLPKHLPSRGTSTNKASSSARTLLSSHLYPNAMGVVSEDVRAIVLSRFGGSRRKLLYLIKPRILFLMTRMNKKTSATVEGGQNNQPTAWM